MLKYKTPSEDECIVNGVKYIPQTQVASLEGWCHGCAAGIEDEEPSCLDLGPCGKNWREDRRDIIWIKAA